MSPVEIAAPVKPLDAKIIDAEADPSNKVEINNMLDALKAGAQETPTNPLPKGNGSGK